MKCSLYNHNKIFFIKEYFLPFLFYLYFYLNYFFKYKYDNLLILMNKYAVYTSSSRNKNYNFVIFKIIIMQHTPIYIYILVVY